ncbi:MAG: transcriptional regulator [Bacteroidota bacterium]
MTASDIEIKAVKPKGTIFKRTMKVIDTLWDSKPGSKEASVLEVLTILVEEYEKKHFPIEEPDPIEAIKFRMEHMHPTKKDLAKYLGGSNRVSEVLSQRRPLTLKMIKNLYLHLHIPAETLLAS